MPNLSHRISKLEQAGLSENVLLNQLSEAELIEYEAYLDASLRWLAAKKIELQPESTPEQREEAAKVTETKLPAKFRGVEAEGGRRFQNTIKNMTDDELLEYELDVDAKLLQMDLESVMEHHES